MNLLSCLVGLDLVLLALEIVLAHLEVHLAIPFEKHEAKYAIRQLLPQYIRIYILHTVPFTCPFSTGRENWLNNQSFLGYQSSPFFLTFLVNDSEVFL